MKRILFVLLLLPLLAGCNSEPAPAPPPAPVVQAAPIAAPVNPPPVELPLAQGATIQTATTDTAEQQPPQFNEAAYQQAMRQVVVANNGLNQTTMTWPYNGDEAAMYVQMSPHLYLGYFKTAQGNLDEFQAGEDDLADAFMNIFMMKRQEMGMSPADARRCRVTVASPDGIIKTTVTAKQN